MEAHPFYRSGFESTTVDKVVYEEGEAVSLSLVYLFVPATAVTWNFYNSSTRSLIKTLNGKTPTTTFTFAEGRDGIDVECVIDFGIHRTVFKKRHRLVIYPNTSVADYTIDVTASGLAEGVPTRKLLNGANYPPVGGRPTIIHLVNNYSSYQLELRSFQGTSQYPTIITTPTGNTQVTFTKSVAGLDDAVNMTDNCNHVWIYGKKSAGGARSLKVINGGWVAQHLGVGNVRSHDNIRISGLEFEDTRAWAAKNSSSGIKPKIDSNTRSVGAFDDLWIFDCKTRGSKHEGIYAGYFNYNYDTAGGFNNYHHEMRHLRIFANDTEESGWDNIQADSVGEDGEVHDNWCKNGATQNQSSQNFEMVLNGGWAGHCYNNVLLNETGNACMQIFPHKHTFVYNNFMYVPGSDNGIFIRRTDNPGLGSPSFDHNDPTCIVSVFGNTIVCDQDPVYMLDVNDAGSGIVPIAKMIYANNAYRIVSGAIEGELRYNEPGGGLDPDFVVDKNYNAPSLGALGIVDVPNHDIALLSSSGVFASAQEGIDISSEVDVDDLPLRMFTDITGQYVPDRGHWRPAHVQRHSTFETTEYPVLTRSSIQWYRTAQLSVFSDREKIPDLFGATVKRYAVISGSAKPRYLMAVKPRAQTGNASGVETLDNESFL